MKKKRRNQKKRIKTWIKRPIFWILLLAAFLRFYKLSGLFHWTLDEEFWAYVPFNIATAYHIPLIGGHISGTGLYSGPLFVWIMSVPFWIFQGNPLGIAVFVSSLGVLTTAAMFWAGKLLFDKKTGLTAALFSASSFLWVIYDRKYWNATPIPLLSILTIASLSKIAKGKLKWAYLLSLVLAIAFHAHMTSGALLAFTVFSWIILKLPIRKKKIIKAVGLFFLLQLPLFLFELRHQFINTKALLSFFSQAKIPVSAITAIAEISRLTANALGRLIYSPPNLDIARELTLCTQYALTRFQPPFWAVVLGLSSILFLIIKRKNLSHRLLLLLIGVNYFGIVCYRIRAGETNWYPGQLSEYFLLPSFPAIFLSLASLANSAMKRLSKKKWLIKMTLAIFVVFNTLALLTATHSDGFSKKRKVVEQVINQIGDQSFILLVETDDPCRLYGYRYLFSIYKKEPVQSYLDPQFNWLYERRLPKTPPSKKVIITSHSGTMNFAIKELEDWN